MGNGDQPAAVSTVDKPANGKATPAQLNEINRLGTARSGKGKWFSTDIKEAAKWASHDRTDQVPQLEEEEAAAIIGQLEQQTEVEPA